MFGHLNQWYEWSNWSQPPKNYLFRTFQSLGSWPIGFRVITRFLQLLGLLGSLVFYLFLVSINFAYTSRNPASMIARKHKWEKSETYIRNQMYKRLVWMAAPISYSMVSWSTKVHLFVYQFLALLGSTDQWPIFPDK